MISNLNNQINNLPELMLLLILPFSFLILVVKINLTLITNYQKKHWKKNYLDKTNLVYEKILLISFQVLIIILNKQINNIFLSQLVPFLSLILFLQFIICFTFLVKKNQKNKMTNNISNFSFMILIIIIFGQFIIISWKLQNLLFTNINNFIGITMIYSIFIIFVYKIFKQNLLVIKHLISETYKILVNKKNQELNKVKKSLTIWEASPPGVTNLWDFTNRSNNQDEANNPFNENKKTIKTQLILFIIACINHTNKNITKLQKIIINGWKISLIE